MTTSPSRLRRVPVCLLGPGRVGRALLGSLVAGRERDAARAGVRFAVTTVVDGTAIVAATLDELDDATLDAIVRHKASGGHLSTWAPAPDASSGRRVEALDPARLESADEAPVIVDTSAADTTPSLLDVRARGWRIVLANKVPLTGDWSVFEHLTDRGRGARWEATVASALPVVGTLRTLLDQGDTVRWITGTLSGTLGALTDRLAGGARLSDAVADAVARGLAEPDPRTDLSGRDVAHKALILARMTGLALAPGEVAAESLYPPAWDSLAPDAFRARLTDMDAPLGARFDEAARTGVVLRYQATIGRHGAHAGWVAQTPDATVGRAAPTDSVVVFETDHFRANPVVISGRGAGPAVTAAAVLGDLVDVVRR